MEHHHAREEHATRPDQNSTTPIEPPADLPEIQRGSWFVVPPDDVVTQYVTTNLWDCPEQPMSWQAARLSRAVYVYRESGTGRTLGAKFYAAKTGSSAQKHARREMEAIQRVQALGLYSDEMRVIRSLGLWRGVLFLEYVDGLSLEDVIAVRRSRPGTLIPCLQRAATMLAGLHVAGARPGTCPDSGLAANEARGYVSDLVEHGVLGNNPITADGLRRAIERWVASPLMHDFPPGLVHGDATTSNFLFPWSGEIVAIDWERLDVADPAADLGRLMAEVAHSIQQHGGDFDEAEYFVPFLVEAYAASLPADWDGGALLERALFYRASSTLRIARNGWVSRLDRTALVAQALALLS